MNCVKYYYEPHDWTIIEHQKCNYFDAKETEFDAICIKIGEIQYNGASERTPILRWMTAKQYERYMQKKMYSVAPPNGTLKLEASCVPGGDKMNFIQMMKDKFNNLPEKIIFLDIDGVLNNDEYAKNCLDIQNYNPYDEDELDIRCLSHLRYIVNSTGASIVLSSSWRFQQNLINRINEQLDLVGLKIYDTTIRDKHFAMDRTAEINEYLDRHLEIQQYVILDDTKVDDPYWLETNMKWGLTRPIAEKAIKILNGEE